MKQVYIDKEAFTLFFVGAVMSATVLVVVIGSILVSSLSASGLS